MKENLDFYCFNDLNVPSKRNNHKNLEKRNYYFLASWRSLTKRAGSGVGSESVSVIQRYCSEDPDPYKNVTHLEHCLLTNIFDGQGLAAEGAYIRGSGVGSTRLRHRGEENQKEEFPPSLRGVQERRGRHLQARPAASGHGLINYII